MGVCEGEDELSKAELKRIEYEQICEDWRHRDSMLWQSLAVSVTLTGAVFVAVFNKDIQNPWLFRTILFLLASLLNCVLMVKISKDHYYQLGSSDLLFRLESGKLRNDYQINPDKCENPFRIWKPSESFFKQVKQAKNACKIPCPCLYECLTGHSAFKWFFGTQLFLTIISFLSFLISLMCFIVYFIVYELCPLLKQILIILYNNFFPN